MTELMTDAHHIVSASPSSILKQYGTPEVAEKELMQLPQAECPVIHRFGPGLYIREVTLPAGIFAVGHHQNFKHMNVMLKGRVLMLKEDGTTQELVAPMMFIGEPGRKVGHILETVVWQNIYATNETDIDTLEATYLTKSDYWQEQAAFAADKKAAERECDRLDYLALLEEAGISHETALAQSENEADQMPMPDGYSCAVVRDSYISGKGLFASFPILSGEVIAPARLGGKRTPAGRFTNHAKTPNARMELRGDDVYLVAIIDIKGCFGGDQGEEITIDYRQALSLGNERKLTCQQ